MPVSLCRQGWWTALQSYSNGEGSLGRDYIGAWLQARAVRKLLAHRLSGESAERAKMEWYEVVEGDHSLWQGVSEPYKHTIRAFLVYFHSQIQRHSTERFNFRNGSVGEPLRFEYPTCDIQQRHLLMEVVRLANS